MSTCRKCGRVETRNPLRHDADDQICGGECVKGGCAIEWIILEPHELESRQQLRLQWREPFDLIFVDDRGDEHIIANCQLEAFGETRLGPWINLRVAQRVRLP